MIMREVVILSAVRTPIGAFQGELSSLSGPDLGAVAVAGAVEKAGIEPATIEQAYFGSVLTAGVGQAPARQAVLGAGCPVTTGAVTVGKVCGSAMKAVMIAANELRCEDFNVVVAGGMESMSQAPYLALNARVGLRLGHGKLIDSMIHDGLWDPYNDQHMGNCGELCAREYGFSREQQDAFAAESYRRAQLAAERGWFDAEIISVDVPQRKGQPKTVSDDEEPGRANLDKMSKLRPAFDREGTITAANASKIDDGAAALVLTTAEHARSLDCAPPSARIVSHASFAQAPEWFTTAPAEAARRAIARAGLQIEDIDLWEVNEAFAVVAMAFIDELGLSADNVNVNGGAVALGHPIGASGARILVTLLHAMAARSAKRGCAAICLGGGEATAIVVERFG